MGFTRVPTQRRWHQGLWSGLVVVLGCAGETPGHPPIATQSEQEPHVAARQAPTLETRLQRRTDDLTRQPQPNGGVLLPLQGRFSHAALVLRQPDGSLQQRCVGDTEALERWREQRAARKASVPSP